MNAIDYEKPYSMDFPQIASAAVKTVAQTVSDEPQKLVDITDTTTSMSNTISLNAEAASCSWDLGDLKYASSDSSQTTPPPSSNFSEESNSDQVLRDFAKPTLRASQFVSDIPSNIVKTADANLSNAGGWYKDNFNDAYEGLGNIAYEPAVWAQERLKEGAIVAGEATIGLGMAAGALAEPIVKPLVEAGIVVGNATKDMIVSAGDWTKDRIVEGVNLAGDTARALGRITDDVIIKPVVAPILNAGRDVAVATGNWTKDRLEDAGGFSKEHFNDAYEGLGNIAYEPAVWAKQNLVGGIRNAAGFFGWRPETACS